MNGLSELVIAIVSSIALIVLALVVFRMRNEQEKLKNSNQILTDYIKCSMNDMAGLCAAAVEMDKRIAEYEMQLSDVIAWINTQPRMSSKPDSSEIDDSQGVSQGYDWVIEKIRRGISLEELVKSCGLTRDEAVLLIRLHGKN